MGRASLPQIMARSAAGLANAGHASGTRPATVLCAALPYSTAATARARTGTVVAFSPAMLIRESLTM